MLTVTADNPLAAGFGLAAMACLVAWPLFRTRATMLIVYIGNNLGFAVHYALLDQWTAVAMNGLMAVQTIVAIWLIRWPRLRLAYYALMPVVAGASIATWQGSPSFLSAVATTLSTIGRMQRNETFLRALLLASAPFWAAHDLIVGSLPGLVADLLSMATGAAMLVQRSSTIRLAMTGEVQRTTLPKGAYRLSQRPSDNRQRQSV
jgi:Bacterial inner membrane protein